MAEPLPASSPPALRDGAALARAGLVGPDRVEAIDAVAALYPMALTPTLAALIDPADPADPIARQFIPDPAELETAEAERDDPIGDAAFSPVKGVVHRYPDRVLLTPLLSCPLYCRFCFRRSRVGSERALSEADLAAALAYIGAHAEIFEVVITGGDPLMLPPARLARLVAALDAIPHVEQIRFHSRIPIGDPARVTPALVAAITPARATAWLAIHCNHPRELGEAAKAACRRLAAAMPLLGQSVLLKGVNADPAILAELFRAMTRNRIKPYYLHHLDLAPGLGHFRVTVEEGQAIVGALRGRVSGVCQPTYVLDIPGGHGKVPLTRPYFADGMVEDWQGKRHPYP